ncbi:MAG TPA: ATP-binding protein [Clostridiales bacterium]|nr:ATP-binding protein [Clostridiales bacterium]
MKEISMHILDIVMNSVKAKATLIELFIEDSIKNNSLKINIKDNGVGMSREMTNLVTDPFFTTRTTRKVGLGIPMLKEACERCNGYLKIDSKQGEGTIIECLFERNNIDRAPIGNMGDTIMTIINSLKGCELIYKHITDGGTFVLSTSEIKRVLDASDINDTEILMWIREYVNENVRSISNI